ncbi:MAG: diguanylate cyclase [Oligoflexales bacterium]
MRDAEAIRVLAVDDMPEILDLYEELLETEKKDGSNYDYCTASSATEALSLFDEFKPDIVILDVHLKDSSGLEICRQIRQMTRNKNYIGIIFVTGDQCPKLMESGLDLGADDFCGKSQTATELTARIRSVVRIKKMADSLQSANDKLRSANERLAKITITDDLSKLYNMKYFQKRLNEEFVRADRYQKHLSLIMIDLDHFKQVNDNHDHLMGSFVLSETGKLIGDSIRSLDIAARFGGDEFIILLPETGLQGARTFADRIGQGIAKMIFDNGHCQARVSASIGVATMGPGIPCRFKSANDLMRAADRFLYEAKDSGRGCVFDLSNTVRYKDADVLVENQNESKDKAS